MKNIKFLFVLAIALVQLSCQKNPFDELESGGWNNERSVIDIKFENQVGKATITRLDDETGKIELAINVTELPDLSSIKLLGLETSYQGKSTLAVGDIVNFENPSKSITMTVTSPTGKSREYTIVATEFEETLVGVYDITGLVLYGGTGPEYGGGGVLNLTDKPWIWPEDNGPQAELDNVLTFELEGFTDEGNTFGKVINDAGEDGLYADFTFVMDPVTDVNHFYRKIPKGEGKWERNYTTGLVTFIFADGSKASGSFEGPGTEVVYADENLSKTIENQAFAFTLNGTDDWDNIYSDYDKFVKKVRKYWIDIKKREE